MLPKKIIIPIPTYGFDPSEVAIPWKLFSENNIEVVFATPNGEKGSADKIMLYGDGLGIWKPLLKAREDAIEAYFEMEKSVAFCQPLKYEDIKEVNFDAIFLPGGHDKGVKEYLESKILQHLVVAFFNVNKPVGAICHGVVLLARSIDNKTKKSVLHNYKTTSLLKSQELLAYNLTKINLKKYYLTYPGLTVEEEVKSVLSDNKNFIKGNTPLLRDKQNNLKRGFIVKDKNYLSARWPGDVYRFSNEFVKMINS
jgi:putative intracellular protease/amidase